MIASVFRCVMTIVTVSMAAMLIELTLPEGATGKSAGRITGLVTLLIIMETVLEFIGA